MFQSSDTTWTHQLENKEFPDLNPTDKFSGDPAWTLRYKSLISLSTEEALITWLRQLLKFIQHYSYIYIQVQALPNHICAKWAFTGYSVEATFLLL